ncbi:N2227-domain-containing protein [Infundibulicybe gibba]|nr:N2227-domain-containing protein [Infundibulicybe gibba]
MALSATLTSDMFIAVVFPLLVLGVGIRLSPFTWSDLQDLLLLSPRRSSHHGMFSVQRAYHAYKNYGRLAVKEIATMQSSYSSINRAHKRLGFQIGYPAKLERLRAVTDLNTTVTEGIAGLAEDELHVGYEPGMVAGTGDLGRVREALKHYVRDWSTEGARERERIFSPILDFLREVDPAERSMKTVLIPGSGLGRLAWEISELGFDATANEMSYFMNLAFRFLLSPETTASPNQHSLRPYAHWFSHQRSNDLLFRHITFPDALPRLSESFHLAERDFLTLPVPAQASRATFKADPLPRDGDYLSGYDFIATLFFIDTSTNVFATMEHIFALLRPGGSWINLGPLLWTSGGQAKLELSLEELIQAAGAVGFVFDSESRSVDCEYTGDPHAMMQWIYRAEFWVARKPK